MTEGTRDRGSNAHEMRVKDMEEREERAKNSVVKKQWLEVVADGKDVANKKKGPKVILCQKMGTGNLQRIYVGRLNQCTAYLEEQKRAGVELKGYNVKR